MRWSILVTIMMTVRLWRRNILTSDFIRYPEIAIDIAMIWMCR